MEIRLTRSVIRDWQRRDAVSLVLHANDREIWHNLKDRFPHPYSSADAEHWLKQALAAKPMTHFAIAIAGEAVGGIGLDLKADVFRRGAEIGYWLGRAHWGRGVMTEAVAAFTDFAFTRFDLCRIEAGVFEWNPASRRVLERAGFTCEGRLRSRITKDGQTIDQWVYALVRG